jgi:hypothetical protein
MDQHYLVAYHQDDGNTQAQFQGVLADSKEDALYRFSKVFPDATILKTYVEV